VEEVQRNLMRVILKTSLLNPLVLSKGWPLLSTNRDETGTLVIKQHRGIYGKDESGFYSVP
jgi:hypothetical protein